MSKIPTPEELRLTKQPFQTSQLIRWAEIAGFKTRKSGHGGSHIQCKHEDFPDLRFTIVDDSKRIANQRTLSDALVQLQKRQEAEGQDLRPAATNVKEEFQKVSKKTFGGIKRALPPYIAAEFDTKNGVVVLRDKNVPQIGMTLAPHETRLLQNKVKEIESMKRDAFALLHRCRTQYDMDVGDLRNGNFGGTIKHAVYQMPKTAIGPYQSGDDPQRLFHELRAYIAEVESKDLEHQVKMEDLLGQGFIRDWQVQFHSRRGERSLVVVCDTPNREGLKLTFSETSNRRCEAHDITSGRMKESELARMEKIISGIATGHERALVAA